MPQDARARLAALLLLALGLIAAGVRCAVAGVVVVRHHPRALAISATALVLFVAGGILNGTTLYGRPRAVGLAGNILFAVSVLMLLITARSRVGAK